MCRGTYSVFRIIPFTKFRVDFDNENSIEILKKSENSKAFKKREHIKFIFYQSGEEKKSFPLKSTKNNSDLNFSLNIVDDIIPELRRVGSRKWRYIPTGEILFLSDVIDRFKDVFPSKAKLRREPEWLEQLKNEVNVRLIESQRLLNVVSSHSPRFDSGTSSTLQTVSAYSEEIAQLIQSKLAEYGTTSQALDRTFPVRVVQRQSSIEMTDEQLRYQLDELEATRSRLIEVGLLEKEESSDFQIQSQFIDESTKNILSVYVEDIEKKLGVFNEIANKIELLRRIVNNKFSYSYKEKNKSQAFALKNEDLQQRLTSQKKDSHDPWQVCCGHDLVEILSLGLRKAIGSAKASDVEPSSLERNLRLSYEENYFCKTQIYLSIRLWESNNQPFKILRNNV